MPDLEPLSRCGACGQTDDHPKHMILVGYNNPVHLAPACAGGIAYFLAARLSVGLVLKPEGVAVFWPAAGIIFGLYLCGWVMIRRIMNFKY